MRDTKEKFSTLTVALHWIVGVTIIALIAVGIYMESYEVYALYDIHKSIGIIILAFVLTRVIWRMQNGWPIPAGDYSTIEHVMAKIVHWVLIIGTLLLPISGMLMSGAGGHGLDIFGLELLAGNPDPNNPEEVIPLNETLAGIGYQMHGLGGDLMIIAIVLHVVGALKHHIVDKDGTLRRMFGANV